MRQDAGLILNTAGLFLEILSSGGNGHQWIHHYFAIDRAPRVILFPVPDSAKKKKKRKQPWLMTV